MAAETLLAYALGLPALGMIIALSLGFLSWNSATESMTRKAKRVLTGRLFVLLQISVIPLLFGIAIYILYLGRIDDLPAAQIEWGALAYGFPGMMAGLAHGIVFHRGVAHAIATPRDFGPTVVLSVLPATAALFGLSLSFLILGLGSAGPASASVVVEAARQSALYMSGGSLAVPAMAYAMVRAWNFRSLETWRKALLVGAAFDVVVLLGFTLSFLALHP